MPTILMTKTTMSCSAKTNDNNNDDQNDQTSSLSVTSSSSSSLTLSSKNNHNNNNSSSNGDSSSEKKSLKSLLKKKIDPNQDFIKSHNKRVKFSETMQVFCYEMPDNQMPQIIALKPDVNLMEFQTYMYDPPAEYQDLLTFEPPPDYRDFIANSLNVFRNEVTFDFIDDDDDSDNIDDHKDSKDHIDISKYSNDQNQNSKWQSMILNNNLDNLEEEQIIGVLKEDDILQAIGSQVTLPETNGTLARSSNVVDENEFEVIETAHNYEENLSSEDFPVHHLNSYFLNSAGHLDDDEEEACCIDSSPNGSLQDLASDSSITSQDTIILINQNKAFHLESVAAAAAAAAAHAANNDQLNNNSINENIYENLQPCSRDANQLVNGTTNTANNNNNSSTSSPNGKLESMAPNSAKDQTSMLKQPQQNEALYENTGELLNATNSASSTSTSSSTSTTSLVANHVKNFENRLSTSSSEDSKSSDSGTNNNKHNNHPSLSSTTNAENGGNSTNNLFKQNILFYEKIVEQKNNNKTANGPLPSHQPQQQICQHKYKTANGSVGGGQMATMVTNNLMPLPCYAILHEANQHHRTSSSSSMSSTTSSSSSLLMNSNPQPSAQQQPNQQTSLSPLTISTTTTNLPSSSSSLKSQSSPNSSISSSSSSSTSNLMIGHEFITNQTSTNNSAMKNQPTVQQIQISLGDKGEPNPLNAAGPYSNNSSGGPASISGHHPINSNVPCLVSGPAIHSHGQPQQSQQHICIVNAPPNSATAGGTPLRPGQVIYRYPYAVIQPGLNGVSTIRPVQYIVQTTTPIAPATAATTNNQTNNNAAPLNASGQQQSIIYNPKLLVSNQIGSYTISSCVPKGTVSSSSSTSSPGQTINVMAKPAPGQTATIIQQAQIVVPNSNNNNNNNNDGHPNPMPVRRIIVPQGTTVLAPRIMQLHHPQHHKPQQPPPPYQCYVQQQQQQRAQGPTTATVMTGYPPNAVQIRQAICQQYHVNDVHHQNNQFPNPSEIRRRDGLYAYPQVLIRKSDEIVHHQRSSQQCANNGKPNESTDHPNGSDDKDELEAFVQQEHQRTERIKKRYSFTEDDDPTFGFARRPSVRGIRPKFGSTNEIIQQITMNKTPPGQQQQQGQVQGQQAIRQQQIHPGPIYVEKSTIASTCGTLPKNIQQHPQQHFIQINHTNNHQQMISIVKQIGDLNMGPGSKNIQQQTPQSAIQLKSQTLPRHLSQAHKIIVANNNNNNNNNDQTNPPTGTATQHEIVRIIDASMLNGPITAGTAITTLPRDQIKLHLQKTMTQQQQQKILVAQQQRIVLATSAGNPNVQTPSTATSNHSTGDGQPASSTFSPNHPNSNNNQQQQPETINKDSTVNAPATAATTKATLVTNDNIKPNQSDIVYYSLNV